MTLDPIDAASGRFIPFVHVDLKVTRQRDGTAKGFHLISGSGSDTQAVIAWIEPGGWSSLVLGGSVSSDGYHQTDFECVIAAGETDGKARIRLTRSDDPQQERVFYVCVAGTRALEGEPVFDFIPGKATKASSLRQETVTPGVIKVQIPTAPGTLRVRPGGSIGIGIAWQAPCDLLGGVEPPTLISLPPHGAIKVRRLAAGVPQRLGVISLVRPAIDYSTSFPATEAHLRGIPLGEWRIGLQTTSGMEFREVEVRDGETSWVDF
jgi:hypothetical protein